MFQDVALVGSNIQPLSQPGLRRGGFALVDEHAGNLLDGDQPEVDRLARDGLELLTEALPGFHCLPQFAHAFEGSAEIDRCLRKIRVALQRLLHGMHGLRGLAEVGMQAAQVEPGSVHQEIGRIGGDPVLIHADCRGMLSRRHQSLGSVDQVYQAQRHEGGGPSVPVP